MGGFLGRETGERGGSRKGGRVGFQGRAGTVEEGGVEEQLTSEEAGGRFSVEWRECVKKKMMSGGERDRERERDSMDFNP